MKDYPEKLKQKMFSLVFILFSAFILGIVFYSFHRNIKTLILTLFLSIYLLYKIINLHFIIKKKDYVEIIGICTSTELIKNILGSYRKVQISDTKYKEYTLITNIKEKLIVGEIYRLYLKKNTDLLKDITNQYYIAIEKIQK